MKKVVCPECGKASTIAEWNKVTHKFYEVVDELSTDDFNSDGNCCKDGTSIEDDVTSYICPKCHADIVYSSSLHMVQDESSEKEESCLVCPKCGSRDLYFAVDTLAQFEVNPDDSIGEINLNSDGVDCICECAVTEPEHIGIHCRDCNSAFHVEYSDDSKLRYKIGDEI